MNTSLPHLSEAKPSLRNLHPQIIGDALYCFSKFDPACVRHLRDNVQRLVRGSYSDGRGRGCIFGILSELLPASQRIHDRESLAYLRKVDIKMYSSYEDLSMAMEKMFSCFITGQSGLHKSSSKDRLTNGSKVDALKDQEYVLTYEDKDADWMLVGDLPWDYFTSICRKLKIMRGSDAVGIAPRTIEQTGQNK